VEMHVCANGPGGAYSWGDGGIQIAHFYLLWEQESGLVCCEEFSLANTPSL